MLKLRLEPGSNLTRLLEASSRSLAKVLNRGVEEGFIRIAVYPSIDFLIAGSIVFSYASAQGANPVFTVSTVPPPVLGSTIFIGYESLDLKPEDLKHPVLAITSGQIKGQPPPGTVYLEGEGSASSIAYLLLETAGLDRLHDHAMLALSASYSTKYVDKLGRFSGLDKVLLELLSGREELSLEMVTTLKSYRPHSLGACESLSITSSPYYPGITGSEGACRSLFEGLGLGNLSEKPLPGLDSSLLEKLVVGILDLARKWSRSPPSASEYLGGVVVSKSKEVRVSDARMALDTLVFSVDYSGEYSSIPASVANIDTEFRMYEKRLELYSLRISRLLAEKRPVDLGGRGKIRVYEIEGVEGDSPTLIWRALRLMGIVEGESIMAVRTSKGAYASLVQVSESLGPRTVSLLKGLGLGDIRGARLWLAERR